jgi:hypothetical protein
MKHKQASLESWRILKERNNDPLCQKTTNNNIEDNQRHQLRQIALTNRTQNVNTFWGHKLPDKKESTFRIGLRNVNSLPTKKDHSKNHSFIQDITDGLPDVADMLIVIHQSKPAGKL